MMTRTTLVDNDIADPAVLYLAFELSDSRWLLAFSDGRGRASKARLLSVPAGELDQLREEMTRAKQHFGLGDDCVVVSCYEAGRDGFWLHRELEIMGVSNVVVDSSSIEVNRRKRRVKTDKLDARRLLSLLLRYHAGDTDLWSVVRVPSVEDEDARHLHRERKQLMKETQQHRQRIQSLLITHGVRLSADNDFGRVLNKLRLRDGRPVPVGLRTRLLREHERLRTAEKQLRVLERERLEQLRSAEPCPQIEKVRMLQQLRSVGINSSWLLVMEFFGWRTFNNRKEVGAAAGLTGCPFDSGGYDHEQGISKAGNPRVRSTMVELSWLWLRYQPESELSQWFQRKWGHGSRRQRKVGIVALARRLLIALWRYVEFGVVPDGAIEVVATHS